MKLSKSKLALAKVINENGGWIDGTMQLAASNKNGSVYLWSNTPRRIRHVWDFGGRFTALRGDWRKLPNWHQTILSREEYYQAYPKADEDGWIEWSGGECPVSEFEAVQVKYKIDDGSGMCGTDAGELHWLHKDVDWDIVAYRLHKPDVKPEFCESVMRCIPEPESHEKLSPEAIEDARFALMSESIEESKRKPTIEQLAQDYRNKLDFAKRKQQEADEANAAADAALGELERAGEALGLLIGIAKPDREPELVITDWRDLRVGDVVECVRANCWPDKFNGMTGEVIAIDYSCDGQPVKVLLGGNEIWCYEVKFISRP